LYSAAASTVRIRNLSAHIKYRVLKGFNNYFPNLLAALFQGVGLLACSEAVLNPDIWRDSFKGGSKYRKASAGERKTGTLIYIYKYTSIGIRT